MPYLEANYINAIRQASDRSEGIVASRRRAVRQR